MLRRFNSFLSWRNSRMINETQFQLFKWFCLGPECQKRPQERWTKKVPERRYQSNIRLNNEHRGKIATLTKRCHFYTKHRSTDCITTYITGWQNKGTLKEQQWRKRLNCRWAIVLHVLETKLHVRFWILSNHWPIYREGIASFIRLVKKKANPFNHRGIKFEFNLTRVRQFRH